jgi:hypothetical protein
MSVGAAVSTRGLVICRAARCQRNRLAEAIAIRNCVIQPGAGVPDDWRSVGVPATGNALINALETPACAENEVNLLLIEPRGVPNTGGRDGERTAPNDVWI